MTCTPEQAAAADLAIRKGMGQHVPDEIIQDEAPVAAQLTYAKHTGTIMDYMVSDAIDKDTHLPVSWLGKQLRKNGIVDSWITENLDPQDYLGRKFTQPLLDALQQHREAAGDFAAFKENVRPVIEHLQSLAQDHFDGDRARLNYANQWLDFWHDGGAMHRVPSKTGVVGRMVDNVVGNLIGGNPFIAVAHSLQVAPKAVAIYGPEATLKGIANWAKSVKQAGTLQVPELLQKGVVEHTSPLSLNPLKTWDNIVHYGDNMARGISYHVAEAHTPGAGLEGVHNIAYVWQPGREPMVLWAKESAMQVALQRYAISGAKMYGGWMKNIFDGVRTGNKDLAIKGAGALAAYSVLQSLFTGVKSTIPAPIYPLLSQETKDSINEIDEHWPHLTAAFGRDMGQHYQPLGGIGFGVAATLLNEDFKGSYGSIKHAAEAFSERDYARFGVDLTKAGLIGGQAFIPGLRLTYKKLWDVIGDAIVGDMQWSDVPEAAAKKLGFPATGTE